MTNFIFIHSPDPPPIDPFPYIGCAFEAANLGKMHCLEYRRGLVDDKVLLEQIKRLEPTAIFYGAESVRDGAPPIDLYHSIREIAPLISILLDGGDPVWRETCKRFRREKRFDLVASIDGIKSDIVDYVTLTPVDYRLYSDPPQQRDIRCGFSGTPIPPLRSSLVPSGLIDRRHPRTKVLDALAGCESLVVLKHSLDRSVSSYAKFMMQCRISVNTSWSQSPEVMFRNVRGRQRVSKVIWDTTHQIKGRVLDAAWARCCLLETVGSPISQWFPVGSYILYSSTEELLHLINTLSDDIIESTAEKLFTYTVDNYHPRKIYQGILSSVGVSCA